MQQKCIMNFSSQDNYPSLCQNNQPRGTDLSMRFMSWSPSPLRKAPLLLGNMRAEQRQLKRFSIISSSSLFPGSCFLKYYHANVIKGEICQKLHNLYLPEIIFLKPKYSFGKWWKWKISLMGIVHKSCMSSQSTVNLFVRNHQFS